MQIRKICEDRTNGFLLDIAKIKVEYRSIAEERRDRSEYPFYIVSANKKIATDSPDNC